MNASSRAVRGCIVGTAMTVAGGAALALLPVSDESVMGAASFVQDDQNGDERDIVVTAWSELGSVRIAVLGSSWSLIDRMGSGRLEAQLIDVERMYEVPYAWSCEVEHRRLDVAMDGVKQSVRRTFPSTTETSSTEGWTINDFVSRSVDRLDPQLQQVVLVAAGWPWLALDCEVDIVRGNPPKVKVRGGIGLEPSTSAVHSALAVRVVPLRPRWIGACANVAVWGVLGESALCMCAVARRTWRQRRGLCGGCGYPCGGDVSICPECGRPLRGRK